MQHGINIAHKGLADLVVNIPIDTAIPVASQAIP